jgi:23S rRNA (cytidine2498-2'-O)-methyltransferase
MKRTGYLAKEGLEKELERELKSIKGRYGPLFIQEGEPQRAYFAQDIWYDLEEISFSSIGDAANQLKAKQKLWTNLPFQNVRRAALIQQKLPYFSPKPISFLSKLPTTPFGSFLLIDTNTMIVSCRSKSPFALGKVFFEEDKTPPSRAYLKLWECFLKTQEIPKEGTFCLELGACPGSWTWVLQKLGLHVTAIDRAPLKEHILNLPNVTFLKRDAFSLKPEEFPEVTFLFSDLICTPEKLYGFVTNWLEKKPLTRFVCTLKFQGDADFEIIDKFSKIEGSQIFHLFHNKHELTWVL